MLKVFGRQKQSRAFKEYYLEWFNTLKKNLLPLLRRSIAGESPTILSSHVEMLHQHFQSYYHALDAAATTDPTQLLSQDWRNSLEKPLLWLADLHPFLFTNLVRSFLHQQYRPETDQNNPRRHLPLPFPDRPWQVALAWSNSSDSLTACMDQIECRLRHIVTTLSDRLKCAESAFMECVVGNWFQCWEEQNIAAAKEAVGTDVKAHMEEVVSVVLYANRVRRSVLVDIMSATTVYQAALFLEGLAQFLIGFREQDLLNAVEQCKVLPHAKHSRTSSH
ncbi:hypothetical protein LR48_Vigan04g018100 [Vigna angularis]|uniref:Protein INAPERTURATE n=1 Tax=Phaseolus angularis TaxID=3914 RepID=A0A0L9UB75_PHAAN|nr:protein INAPERTURATE POLLEN1 [Vigna angularis]KAG2398698.1 Protein INAPERTURATE [Vigna angularis]KOM39983.1 hypothetical protein LR48_Vigan04g018100 [Vigna angularis]